MNEKMKIDTVVDHSLIESKLEATEHKEPESKRADATVHKNRDFQGFNMDDQFYWFDFINKYGPVVLESEQEMVQFILPDI